MAKRGPQRRKPGGAMFGLFFALLAMFLGLWFLGVGHALAQSASPPGSGHGFLIDKHTAANVDCHACHVEEPASKPPEMAMCLSCHGGTYSRTRCYDPIGPTKSARIAPRADPLFGLPSRPFAIADVLQQLPQRRSDPAVSAPRLFVRRHFLQICEFSAAAFLPAM